MTRPVQWTVAAALIAAAGVAGFVAYRALTGPYGAPQPQTPAREQPQPAVTVLPDDAIALPESASRGALPEKRPEFSLRDRDGRLRSIGEWDGKSLVINFWATWCAPCRREIPMLRALNRARAKDNIEVLGIAVDFREKVIEYADEIGLDYALLIGEQDGLDALAKFGVATAGFPFTVFTDDQGRIVTAHVGELHADEAGVILDSVVSLNRGRLSLDQARRNIETGLGALEER